MSRVEECFICGSDSIRQSTVDYFRCNNCGHEILFAKAKQGFIINDHLCKNEVARVTGLDRFKSKILSRFDAPIQKKLLLDIGSASGRFIYQNGFRYQHSVGLEITPESLKFSREILNLRIVKSIFEINGEINVATAWHSLEHVPKQELLELLGELAAKLKVGGRVIVSVPNSASRQYRWFKCAFAYYDVPNHLHQFTPLSLELLMGKFGLKHIADINSWNYNVFGYVQGLLNLASNTHNYLYYRVKRRSIKPSFFQDIFNGLLLVLFVPLGWLLSIVDALNLKKQGVMTVCFEKST